MDVDCFVIYCLLTVPTVLVVGVESLSCVQLFCGLMDCSPLGSSLHGISQAGILERVAISFSRGSFRIRGQTHVSLLAGEFFITELPGKL